MWVDGDVFGVNAGDGVEAGGDFFLASKAVDAAVFVNNESWRVVVEDLVVVRSRSWIEIHGRWLWGR